MKKQKMDLWMTDSLDGYASPIPIGGWKGLHKGRGKRKNKLLFWISAACILLFASLALWNFEVDPARDQHRQTENLVPQKQAKRPGEQKTGPVIPAPEQETIPDKTPPIKINEEIPGVTKSSFTPAPGPAPGMESVSIGNKHVAPFFYSIKEENTIQLKEKKLSRFSNRFSFFVEAGLSTGKMDFADDANLAQYRSSYSSYIKSQDLRQIERSFGFVLYYQGSCRWALGTGMSLSHNTASGKVDYAYYESGRNLVGLGTQTWEESTLDQTENLSHKTEINSWSIYVPLRFRFQPFAFYGPFMEIGACYSYNLSNQGNWLDPETLTIERSRNLVPKHLFSAELSFGYQWKLSRSSVALHYRFSPWSSKYAPIQGRMGTNLHGIHIQVQLPH